MADAAVLQDEYLVPSPELIDQVRVGRGDFRQIGDAMLRRFTSKGWLKPDFTFLDIGCGLGRLARPLVPYLTKGRYIGFDINRTSIDWCNEKYRDIPSFEFHHVDAQSVVYNPNGSREADTVRFPLPDASVDFINMSSVFTHMWPKDVQAYLHECYRLLKPGARCWISYFLWDPLSKMRIDPTNCEEPLLWQKNWTAIEGGYLRYKDKPEDVVLLDETLVRQMYANAGLLAISSTYGGWNRLTRGTEGGDALGQDEIEAIRPQQ